MYTPRLFSRNTTQFIRIAAPCPIAGMIATRGAAVCAPGFVPAGIVVLRGGQ